MTSTQMTRKVMECAAANEATSFTMTWAQDRRVQGNRYRVA
jgi:hypothetical protein